MRRFVAAQAPPQTLGMHEIREGLLTLDEDDRNPLPVAPLEVRIAPDVDLLELERDFRANLLEDAARALAQMAPLGGVDTDPRDRAHA